MIIRSETWHWRASRQSRSGKFHLDPETRGIGVNEPGAFAQYLRLPAFNVVPLPDAIDAAPAALPLRSVLPAFVLDVVLAITLSFSMLMLGLFGWAAWRGVQLAQRNDGALDAQALQARLLELPHYRLWGVLQRIAVCSALVGLLHNGTAQPMALVICACGVLAVACATYTARISNAP